MENLQSTRVQLLTSQTEQQQQKHEEKLLKMMELLKRTQDTKPAGFFPWMLWLILWENSSTILKKELHSLLIFADMRTLLEMNARSGSKRNRYVSYFKNWTRCDMTDIVITFYQGVVD